MSAQVAKRGTEFYEQYKPLPTTTQARITYFRKKLIALAEVSICFPSDESVRINILNPVLRGQEQRKIGRLKGFESTPNDTRVLTPRKYFPMKENTRETTPRSEGPPKKPKQVPRAVGDRKKALNDGKDSRKAIFVRSRSARISRTGFPQAVLQHAQLMNNKRKIEKVKKDEKARKAVKYLKNFEAAQNLFVRERQTPPSTTVKKEKIKVQYYSAEKPRKADSNTKSRVKLHSTFKVTSIKTKLKDLAIRQNGSRTARAKEPFHSLMDALEELALSPVLK
eukprot:TRINITY_DN13298_c0_g4_i1.p1 TRINITY_DN13298_c0_g4~~TRINITY_DN13298_c0_g4_i1.p1  ORF type:complete len:280 (-),score=53.80 TRINITY_DN13298_c0_g4_i1:98-937(-)